MARKVTDRTRYLLHISPYPNNASIIKRGLLTQFSRGKRRAVWLISPGELRKRYGHIAGNHKHETSEDFEVWVVAVRRSKLVRTSWRGVWYTYDDIAPDALTYFGKLDEYNFTRAFRAVMERECR